MSNPYLANMIPHDAALQYHIRITEQLIASRHPIHTIDWYIASRL